MEIRFLQGTELAWAVETANQVFETCVRCYTGTQEEVSQYYGYVNVQGLWQEICAGRLAMWGAFENGQMCAVSAIQNVGHITMLYVKQEYCHRRVGMQLLQTMKSYASLMWGQSRVTINVTPIASAPFFYRMGFQAISGLEGKNFFLSMECMLNSNPMTYPNCGAAPEVKKQSVTYQTKSVSTKMVLGLTAAFFVISIGIMSAFTIYHMVTDQYSMQEEVQDDWNDPSGLVEV